LQSEPRGFALSDDFLRGAQALVESDLSFDACVIASQVGDVTGLARRTPGLRIVLDHLGKPRVGVPEVPLPPEADWLRDIRDLAREPNVLCKISGLPAESPTGWAPAQFTPFLDAVLEAFGPDRLMLGGDWPVSLPYSDWFRYLGDWLADLSEAEADAIRWGNARRFYRLPAD
jgi:L-fuconolactonase